MGIVRHDVSGSGGKGAVHKLIIIGIGGDEVPMVVGVDKFYVPTIHNHSNDIGGNLRRSHVGNHFLILCQNLVSDTERVSSFLKSFPDGVGCAAS